MRSARDVDDPCAFGGEQAIEQQSGQREVPEVIGAELHLEAVGSLTIWDRHDAGVVAQHMQRLALQMERVGEAAHRGEVRQVEFHHVDLGAGCRCGDIRRGGARFAEVAAGQDDVRMLSRELPRRFQADAAIGAGYDDRLAGKIGHVICGPRFLVGHRQRSSSSAA